MRPRIAPLRLPQLVSVRYNSTLTPPEALKHSLIRRKPHIYSDRFSSRPQRLLRTSLEGFLPPRPDFYDEAKFIYPGFHLVYFPPHIPQAQLLPDGTDLLHAPNSSYKYRLWAGGDVSYPSLRGISVLPLEHLQLTEKIVDVKVKAGKEPSIWVKINRELSQVPKTSRRELLIVENRWLVFFQSKPSVALKKVTPPPIGPDYSHKTRTTKALLFRFSALTFNAHAIHIDPEYTKNEYGLPGLVVHGPLTFVLMMEVLANAVDQHARENGLTPKSMLVRDVNYKNIMPIFVGEQITICCALRHERISQTDGAETEFEQPDKRYHTIQTDGDGIQKDMEKLKNTEWEWEVWVQKMVNGQPSLCVKATATVIHWFPKSEFTIHRSIKMDDPPVRRMQSHRRPPTKIDESGELIKDARY